MATRRSRGSGGKGGVIAALLVGLGVVGAAVFALARRPRPKADVIGRIGPRGPVKRQQGGQDPSLLRESILGASKQMVQSVFGPPRSAGDLASVPPHGGTSAYWDAEVWYYALDPRRRMAMAVRFVNGVASEVDFVQGPVGE